MMTAVTMSDLEHELLQKIEIEKMSRQLKLKLGNISSRINKNVAGKPGQQQRKAGGYLSHISSVSNISNSNRRNTTSVLPNNKAAAGGVATAVSVNRLARYRAQAMSPSSSRRSVDSHSSPLRARKYATVPSASNSNLTTPKAKTRRTFESQGNDEGANLLMYLATSPSPYKSGNVASSPIRNSKSFHENAPSTPNLSSRIMSSPTFSINNTIVRSPIFNMSDYVNFLTPSPRAKKNHAERMSTIERISTGMSRLTKDEETEDEEDE